MADYLQSAEVAALLNVSPKTVSRWAKAGKLSFTQTLGGHRRYSQAEVEELVASLHYHSDFEPVLVSTKEAS
jgi:excisionase family DNA binding protein